MSVESDECSGRPHMSRNQLTTDEVHSVVLDECGITIRELSNELGLSFGLVQSIPTEDLDMKCVSVKSAPKLLTVEQKQTCLEITRYLLQCADQDANIMKTIIANDEP
jgi:hypothetical protein